MTVKEAINLLGYGVAYQIRGAYSGKIYHKSYNNNIKHLEKYADIEVTENPFYVDLAARGTKHSEWYVPIVTISMYDYDLCKH